eukprot:908950_1
MPMLSLIVFLFCLLHLNGATQLNVEVTLHRKDISLFTEGEMWGRTFINATAEIIQLNVVIDENKWIKIRKINKDVIMKFDVIYSDVEKVIQTEKARINNTAKWTPTDLPDLFFQEYRNWAEYELFIESLLFRFPEIASRSVMGQTIQGRNIPIITLSTGPGPKPGLYFQAVVHAREWLANAATMYIMNAMAERYNSDDNITKILNAINIYIAPTVNIDGYIYSFEVSRMWRKNRRDNGGNTFGVDINRNYDGPTGTWCTTGASTNPSSDTYCGTSPFSEPETEAVRQFILNEEYNIQAAIDIHTSGPLILWPWGYSYDQLPTQDYQMYDQLGKDMEEACYAVNGVRYASGQSSGLYPASGAMEDFAWAQSNGKTLGLLFEGRGPGFNPSPDNIIGAGEEQL